MIIIHNMMDEGSVTDRLLDFLRQQPEVQGISFDYAGPNTERVHVNIITPDEAESQ